MADKGIGRKARRVRKKAGPEKLVEPASEAGEGSASRAGEGDAFDRWLEDKLRTAYSSVLEEPIPEDLLKLLDQKLKD